MNECMSEWFEIENENYYSIRPLFIWAGGKSKMWKYYEPILKYVDFDNYCEPFFGGGAMLLKVLQLRPNLKRIVINDINDGIVRIYKSIKHDVDNFIEEIDRLESSYISLDYDGRKKLYFDVRKEHAYDYKKWDETIEAAHLYFLMKTGFNGIWQINKNTNNRYGTPNGLLNHKTNIYDKQNVKMWHDMLQRVVIYSEDWKVNVNRIKENNAFFFFDPPYRGGFADYNEVFSDENQVELVKWCNDLQNSKSFFCNREWNDGFFEKHKGDLQMKKFPVTYTVGRRKKTKNGFKAMPATEILLYKI